MQKIIDLENDLQAKNQENKLLVMKFKNIAISTNQNKSQINLSHPGSQTKSMNSFQGIKPNAALFDDQRVAAGMPTSQKQGRSKA